MQLYTVRDQTWENPAGALQRLASLGYTTVETACWPEGMTVQLGAQLLRDAGLSACSAHIELPATDASRAATLAAARAYGCARMIWHGWPEDRRYRSLEGTRGMVAAR